MRTLIIATDVRATGKGREKGDLHISTEIKDTNLEHRLYAAGGQAFPLASGWRPGSQSDKGDKKEMR